MLVFSFVRIAFMEDDNSTFTGFMISFYLILFAIVFILVECNIKKSRMWFFFLNGTLGKALFYLFLFVLCYGNGGDTSWVEVLLSVIFIITAVIFFAMHCFFKEQEPQYIQQLIGQIDLTPQSSQPLAKESEDSSIADLEKQKNK